VVRIVPGYRDCGVTNSKFKNCGQILGGEDVTGFGTVTGSGFLFEGNSVDGVELPKAWDLHGRRNGASVDTLLDIRIANNTWRNLHGGGIVRYVTELEFAGNKLDEVTVDGSFTYALELENITGGEITRNDFKSFDHGVKLTSCTDLRGDFNRMADQISAIVLNDAGGNTGYWCNNLYEGAVAPLFVSGNSLIAFRPRLPAAVNIADDTAVTIMPLSTRGRAFLSSLSGTSFIAQFSYYTVTPAIDVGGSTSPIVDFTTGALTGTTGTDGKITISVHTDGTLRIENRTGSVLKIDGELS
jgi:hypothetical protein